MALLVSVPFRHCTERGSLLFCPGTSTLPDAPGRKVIVPLFCRRPVCLGRAAVVAPAGLIIWCMANLYVGDASVLTHCAQFLDPFIRLLGLDGVILAFILRLPRQRDRGAHYHHDLSVHWKHDGL